MNLPPYQELNLPSSQLLIEEGDDDAFVKIREYYSDYLPSGAEAMPYYFLVTLRQFSFNKDSFLDEWEYYSFIEKENDLRLRCICSHFISDVFLIRNKYNFNLLPVGSSCVHKIFPISSTLLKTFRVKSRIIKHSRKYRECLECKKQNIPLADEKIRCKKCIDVNNLTAEKKFCLVCGAFCLQGLNCPKHPIVILSPMEAIKMHVKSRKARKMK